MKFCPHCKTVLPDLTTVVCPACSRSVATEATLDRTIDLSPELTKVDETLDVSSIHSHAIGAILDLPDVSPGATISFGPSGITQGRSGAMLTPPSGTVFQVGPSRGSGTVAPFGTARDTGNIALDSSIDLNKSIVSTMSKRSLAEENDSHCLSPDYKIVSKLGEGGMGVVFSAIQKTLDRKVAIKAIKSGKATTEASRRKFFYEAQITGDLDHPNIVPIHDMGSDDDGTLFYAMKMVDGTPWENVLLEKTREENIEIFMKICDAVAFAHSRNIIHRDLKPENVMLGAFGEVLVMDWGLAVDLNTTTTFGMSGTPVYMSPEMACHDLSKIGKTSDIYILGAILFQIVVGKAPHKGKTVRECIANAIKNINIETDIEDPLLDIANHAMATEPNDRYATVVEIQDAIREHVRYSQSIALTHRAEDLLQASILNKDYQGFSRALFSMQDAVDMWPGNEQAKDGIHRTRLAYGQCAIEQGDYDLCLQTLDVRVPAEAAIAAQANEKKAAIVQREKGFKLLRRILVGVVILASVVLSIATLYAQRQARIADASAQSEKMARVNEADAKRVAIEERNRAQQSAEDEKAARDDEKAAKLTALLERDKAVMAEMEEKQAKELEVLARQQAVESETNAKKSEQKAKLSEQVAIRSTRLALLGNYQSQINLALNHSNQFDTTRSSQLLQQIKAINVGDGEPQEYAGSRSLFDNWAFRRIELLNNVDLPNLVVPSQITAFEVSVHSGKGILGTLDGHVYLVQIDHQSIQLIPDRTLVLPDAISAVALSVDGNEAIIATQGQRSEFSVHRWDTKAKESQPVRSLGRRNLQRLAVSSDGQWGIGGINGGLWRWKGTEHSFASEPSLQNCKGVLQSLQFPTSNSDDVFGAVKLPNGKTVCLRVSLNANTVQTYLVPDSEADQVTSAAMARDGQQIYLGLSDGRILIAKMEGPPRVRISMGVNSRLVNSPDSETLENLKIVREVLPKKHTTAVRGFQVHPDGTVLTHSDEPVVHVWQPEKETANLVYKIYLAGLHGNVVTARFLSSSEDIAGADDHGNLLLWNTKNQAQRRMQFREMQSQVVSQSVSNDHVSTSIDRNGVMQRWANRDDRTVELDESKLGFSFVGHTPGAEVTDIALARSNSLVSTVAKLGATSVAYGNRESGMAELCLWNIDQRRMLARIPVDTSGICRVAFANQDKSLIVGDGNKTFIVSVAEPNQVKLLLNFGASIAIAHPTQRSLAAIIAPSGSVRLIDFEDPTKWDDAGYRFFDTAINNRYGPIEAAWSQDGKRLFMVFENGRIARLEWNGSELSNLNWTKEFKSIKTQEQVSPWRFMDLSVSNLDLASDILQIMLRVSDAKQSSQFLRLTWGVGEPDAVMETETKQLAAMRLAKPMLDAVPEATLAIDPIRSELADIDWSSDGTAIAVDVHGTLGVLKPKANQTQFIGRPKCVQASHAKYSKRVVTVHESGVVLIGTALENGTVMWVQLDHPFRQVLQAELSHDGNHVAIVGRTESETASAPCVLRFDVSDGASLQPVAESKIERVFFVRWLPQSLQLVVLNSDMHWRVFDISGTAEPREIEDRGWAEKMQREGREFSEMQWLIDSKAGEHKQRWHMALQSNLNAAKGVLSRVDFIPFEAEASEAFNSIESGSLITSIATSPTENLLAIGDVNGTLGIWFAAPSVDREPRELFTLPGHRGAAIGHISFSEDGSKILSSDTNKRTIQWNSLEARD